MITFVLRGHSFIYDVQTMIQVFVPNETYKKRDCVPDEGICFESRLDGIGAVAVLYRDGVQVREAFAPLGSFDNADRRAVKLALYEVLTRETGMRPPWGLTTGVRPAKLAREILEGGAADAEVLARLTDEFYLLPDKAQLALAVAYAELAILRTNDGTDCALYIGIPFCPTRCAYCSFAAVALDKKTDVDGYLDSLERELARYAVRIRGRRLESVYIGGGTPTALTETQLARLLSFVRENFSFDNVKEFTVEAGRPDTITAGKLLVMRNHDVTRISVNPQTLHDETLAAIGRQHTTKQFFDAYDMAQQAGFDNINIDIIAGLPGESAGHMAQTLEGIARLVPNALTVHTLAVKRSSRIWETLDKQVMTEIAVVEDMLRRTREACEAMDLQPYYMYRQKNMLGNFENVGYARAGYAGVYNVQMMEERQSVFAAGAGAVGKVVFLAENRVERVANCKDYRDYIRRMQV